MEREYCVKKISFLIFNIFFISHAFATDRVVDLTIAYKTVYFAGKPRKAIAVNNQIPAPTLHFKEGDHVTLNVYNKLDQETAIHWHGMILPWQMDGVLGINQQGIPPGGIFHYQFTLHQSGTYWYHAHAGLQEQLGLYGAFLIDPPRHPPYRYTQDYVVVLSDWSNTHPNQILSNLKKTGDYYAPRFPLQPSLVKFIREYQNASSDERTRLIGDYKTMQQMRMSLYDFSDVAYDAFLLNGQPQAKPWTALVKVGDSVRLRFIGAGGSTIFHVKIPGTALQIVHVDGNDVRPYTVNDFTIAPGETYDALVKIQKKDPYIIYAESIDTVGAAYGALVTSPNQLVSYQQGTLFPEPLPVTRNMMTMMMGPMKHGSMSHEMPMNSHMKMTHDIPMNHAMDMRMPTESTLIGDRISPPTVSYTTSSGTKYENVTAAVKTNDPLKPIAGVIHMELFGYMDRYIWFINGIPEDKAHPIVLAPGKRYRFIFTNTSMMHHPMHIHGHWFILRKGNGAYDPLLHTIDVAPGTTIMADVDTDASGQWIFHCHFLYHMMAGMARTFQYATLIEITQGKIRPQDIVQQTAYHNRPIVRVDEVMPIDASLVKHPMAHPAGLWFATGLDVSEDPFNNIQSVTYKGLYGSDYNKLEFLMNDAEINQGRIENADMDFFYWRLISQFWALKGGASYFYRPALTPYWQPGMGIEGLMPYFIDTDMRMYYDSGSVKLDVELSRDTQITNNFFIRTGLRSIIASKTVSEAQIGSGLNQMRYILRPYYRLTPSLTVFIEYEREQNYGPFKSLQNNIGESALQNIFALGFSMLF